MTREAAVPTYEIGKIYSIDTTALQPNPQQPRKYFDEAEIIALAKDIEVNGLLQNVVFTVNKGKLIIVAGERRVRACKQIGWEKVDAKYVEGDLQTLALMENILRSDLTAVELAESVAALQKQKECSNDDIAVLIGKRKSTVSEILRVAGLPEGIRNDAREKPYMTRERLLKVARWKTEDAKNEAYKKLCESLKPTGKNEKGVSPKQTSISGRSRFVTWHLQTIQSLTDELENKHAKMLAKLKDKFSDNDKKDVRAALEKMKESIEIMLRTE